MLRHRIFWLAVGYFWFGFLVALIVEKFVGPPPFPVYTIVTVIVLTCVLKFTDNRRS